MKSRTHWMVTVALFSLLSACSSGPQTREISKKEKMESLLSIAGASVTENDATGALQALTLARDVDDKNPELYYLYSLAYLQKNELKLASDSARYALKLSPNYSAAKNALGKILLDQGKFEESEKYLLEASNDLLYREAALSKMNLGILNYKKMNLEAANSWLTKSIEDHGALECVAHFYRGKVKLAQNQLLMAERDFNQAAKGSCSGAGEMHLAVAQTLVREKKYDQARAKFIEIQRLFPSSDISDQATQYLRDIP